MGHIIVGLTGYARAGKDTVGGVLIREHGFVRMGFADLLRKVAYDTDPHVETTQGRYERVSAVVDRLGWERAKGFEDVRRLLQRLGTEGGRTNLGEGVWVDPVVLAAELETSPVVITDVRYRNECEAVRGAGGKVFRVERPGFSPVNSHSSDTGVDSLVVDGVIANDGTLQDLVARVGTLVESLEYLQGAAHA